MRYKITLKKPQCVQKCRVRGMTACRKELLIDTNFIGKSVIVNQVNPTKMSGEKCKSVRYCCIT